MGRAGRIAIAAVAAVIALIALAQLLLPRIAASRISSRVARYGKVHSVSVKAWPAIELLWGNAESVHVSAGALALSTGQAAKLLGEAHGVETMDVSATSVRLGSLRLTDATLHKHGDAASAAATVSEADVRAALPEGFDVQLLRSHEGEVEVQASGGLFGVGASVDAVALASEGKLVAHPVGFLIDNLQLTLFSDPHVYVQAIGASVSSQSPRSYRLTIRALVR